MIDTKACFPNTRGYDFRQANTPEFVRAQQVQKKLFGNQQAEHYFYYNACREQECIDEKLEFLYKVLTTSNTTSNKTAEDVGSITIPHVYSNSFLSPESFLTDRYYQVVKDVFSLDDSVCALIPDPDETVLVSVLVLSILATNLLNKRCSLVFSSVSLSLLSYRSSTFEIFSSNCLEGESKRDLKS